MTLAPRIEVLTQLSCNGLHGHGSKYNHTSLIPTTSTTTSTLSEGDITPFYYSIDPLGPILYPHDVRLAAAFSNHTIVSGLRATNDGDEEEDARYSPSDRCLSDPTVQTDAARLQTMMTITMGLLSVLTTGWWGHFGERHGRTKVLAIVTFGLFMTDFTYILVSTPSSPFAAHGQGLLILASIIEGVFGGWSALQSATHAYLSDCTSSGSRAHIFSRFAGVFYIGSSVGPSVGGYLIQHPFFASKTNKSLHKAKRLRAIAEHQVKARAPDDGITETSPMIDDARKDSEGVVRQSFCWTLTPSGIIAAFKPKAQATNSSETAGAKAFKPKPTRAHLAREIAFDLLVTRCSLLIDVLSNVFITLGPVPVNHSAGVSATQSQVIFVLASGLSSWGSGAPPAFQSLGLCIVQTRALEATVIGGIKSPREEGVGQLLGALAVLQALGQMIMGPMLFGMMYSGTVAIFPKAVFVTASGLLRTHLHSTQDLLGRFHLLSAYDKYVRPFAVPAETSQEQLGTAPVTPGATGGLDKGKGKETEGGPVTPVAHEGDGADDEGGKGDKRQKNNYKHLIKGIPGKHSMKKDDYLTTMMLVPPKQRIKIAPFDGRTHQEAFTVSLEGLKGWNPTALVIESAQVREDRKKRVRVFMSFSEHIMFRRLNLKKETKRLQKLQAQAALAASVAQPQPIPASASATSATTFNRPPQNPNSTFNAGVPPTQPSESILPRAGSTVPKPAVPRPGSTVPRPGSTKPYTSVQTTMPRPYTAASDVQRGIKRERDDGTTAPLTNGLGVTHVNGLGNGNSLAMPKAIVNAKAGSADIGHIALCAGKMLTFNHFPSLTIRVICARLVAITFMHAYYVIHIMTLALSPLVYA
ncbi:hypothetical protein C0992_001550 [Termitomyces sp. T32_za158]|nr:hypothetical protein C0992_001550 [Termitomyces sp. T32_za158]